MDPSRDLPAATERLTFGVWGDENLPLAESLWGDPVVTELTGGPFTPEAVAQRHTQEMENWRRYHIQYWPLFRRDDGAFVGCCGLRPRNMEERVAELGFQLCRDSWGQGLASEASSSVIKWARMNRFSALIAGHHPSNQASKRALVRLGFSYTHDEIYPPTAQMEPCYCLRL